jgi:hypothetical protein
MIYYCISNILHVQLTKGEETEVNTLRSFTFPTVHTTHRSLQQTTASEHGGQDTEPVAIASLFTSLLTSALLQSITVKKIITFSNFTTNKFYKQ